MKYIYKYIIVILVSLSFITCDLEVENTNHPDREDVLASAEGVNDLTAGLFNKWFRAEQHNLSSPGPAMWVAADWGTVTWANYGCVDASAEPRIPLNNTASHNHHRIIKNFWQNMYAVVTTSNDILQAIDRGVDLGDDEQMIKAMSHLMQGLGNGYIGLVYDKGYPSDETSDYNTLSMQPYSVSIDMAIEQLEKAIVVFDSNSFTIPEYWMTRSFTNEDLSKIAHSFIARLLVYSPRNTTQNANIDWQRVLDHAQAGITEDFTIEGDGNVSGRKWMSWYKYYLARPSWGKVDMRIINMMDSNQPANWPEGGISSMPFSGLMVLSPDARANTDFQYDGDNNRPERGKYRWSTYRYARFDSYINASFFAPVVMMRKAENDLFIAEAYANLTQFQNAADIINAGTRVTRGNLSPVSNDEDEVNNAIIYERTIELPLTGMGIQFFDMRRRGQLQDGSLLHFPIPAQQLDIIGFPTYTFGGVEPQFGIPNEDVSINGWYAAE